jgi:predicted DNA-binding protein (UPF0251 family)
VSDIISWIAAVAESEDEPDHVPFGEEELRQNVANEATDGPSVEDLPAHQFPAVIPEPSAAPGLPEQADATDEWFEFDRRRRIYRGRTVAMLRRYMRYSLETGRLPSLLGREFFRSKVTSYRVTTFEDRVIFVHDMEMCLHRLDELSRQVLARIVLQEYEHEEAAQLIGCTRMTIHRRLLEGLDKMSDILIAAGLLEDLLANP